LFTHVTVVPLGTAMVASLNWKISDVISVGGGSGVFVGTGVSVGELIGVEVDSDAAVANADGDSAVADVAVLVGTAGRGVSEGVTVGVLASITTVAGEVGSGGIVGTDVADGIEVAVAAGPEVGCGVGCGDGLAGGVPHAAINRTARPAIHMRATLPNTVDMIGSSPMTV
jgi:hypothetical protein